jgi:dinuclear metal center YbgI/SA1388 family protein
MERNALVTFLDEYLRIRQIPDDSLNGLQVTGTDQVLRIASTTDAGLLAFRQAAEQGAQMLLVHHGLFWGSSFALVGVQYERMRELFRAECSLYAAHLPLDLHPEVGNNAVLARMLGLQELQPFGFHHGVALGWGGILPTVLPLEQLRRQLEQQLQNRVEAWPFGKEGIRTVAIVSGYAGDLLAEGFHRYDLLITGGAGPSIFRLSQDAGQSILFAGHYASETVGVKALGEFLAIRFGLEHVFLDLPCPY